MLQPPLAAILIDLDGTLVDSEPVHMAAHRDFLSGQGIDATPHDVRGNIGQSDRDFYAGLAKRQGRTIDIEAWIKAKGEILMRYFRRDGLPARRGVTDILAQAWQLGICCCVVTSSDRVICVAALTAAGLADRLPIRVCFEDTVKHKPDPAPYQLAAERLGVPIGHCLVIEDSLVGVRSAVAAGALTVGFAGLIAEDELRKAGAIHCVHDLTELLPLAQLTERFGGDR